MRLTSQTKSLYRNLVLSIAAASLCTATLFAQSPGAQPATQVLAILTLKDGVAR